MLDHIQAEGHKGNDEDIRTVSELMDDIRDAITDYQVSAVNQPSTTIHR